MVLDMKIVKPVLVAEVADNEKPLIPGGASPYLTGLIPAGQKVAVVLLVGGVEKARREWVALPKAGFNSAIQVRARVFDTCAVDTLKPVAVVEEIL